MAAIPTSLAVLGTNIKSGSVTEVSKVYENFGDVINATGENKKTYWFQIRVGGQTYRSIDYSSEALATTARADFITLP